MTSQANPEAKAILFDMDGVLINNHHFHVEAWEQFNRKYDKKISTAEFMEYMSGRTSNAAVQYLFGKDLPMEQVLAYAAEKEEIYRTIYKPHMKPVAGLYALLEALEREGWLMAVATSAIPENLEFVLEGLGIRPYFQALIDSTQVERGKPAPDLYLRAAEVLGVAPERCIVFEDSLAGIEAGQRAGMQVVALTTTHSREELAPANVHWVFDSFEYVDEKFLNLILANEAPQL